MPVRVRYDTRSTMTTSPNSNAINEPPSAPELPASSTYDDSWFSPVLDHYRDPQGRTLEQAEAAWLVASDNPPDVIDRALAADRWKLSPKSEHHTTHLLRLIERFFGRDDAFTYLEFGTCFGTTLVSVMRHFQRAGAIGLEINPARFDITRWLVDRMREPFVLGDRVALHLCGLTDAPLPAASVDVVFMDTNHRYPDDYEYIVQLLGRRVLTDGFLFVGDDPLHTGTCQSRERFIREYATRFTIETCTRRNLWWFTEPRPSGRGSSVARYPRNTST